MALRCGGMTTAGFAAVGLRNRYFRQKYHAISATAIAAATHQSHAYVLGISTGPFSGWISTASAAFVPPAGEGERRALLLLAMPQTFFPGFEESRERSRIRLAGAQLDGVDVRRGEEFFQFALSAFLAFGEGFSFARVTGVYFHQFAGFCIAKQEVAERGEFQFEFVDDLDGDDVVLAIGLLEGGGGGLSESLRKDDVSAEMCGDVGTAGGALSEEIGDNDGNGSMRSNAV